MSIIKSTKQVLGLGPAAENHHWDGSVPNQLSLKRGTPEAPGTELIKALDGILSFPQNETLLSNPGYARMPNGLLIQWGLLNSSVGGVSVIFPKPFSTILGVVVSQGNGAAPGVVTKVGVRSRTNSGMIVDTEPNQVTNIGYIALGV